MAGAGANNQIIGIEIDTVELNAGSFPAHNPYLGFGGPVSIGLGLGSGGGTSTTFPSTVAVSIGNNTAPWLTGIQFQSHAIFGDDGVNGSGEAIALAKGHVINWYAYDAGNCPPCGFVDAFIRMDSVSHTDPVGLEFTDGTFTVQGTNSRSMQIAGGTAMQAVQLSLIDATGPSFMLTKDASNNFDIFDSVNSKNLFQFIASSKQVSIGEGGPSSVFINANALVFPAVAAPSTPPVGFFYIYMDAATNKLMAKGPSGTPTVLAVP